MDGSLRARRAHRTPPGERVGLINPVYLSGRGDGYIPVPRRTAGAGPLSPLRVPQPSRGHVGPMGGVQVAHVRGPFSILALESFSASICPQAQARSPVFQSWKAGCYPSTPHVRTRQIGLSSYPQHFPQAGGRLCLRREPPGLEQSPLPRAPPRPCPRGKVRRAGGPAGKSFSSFPQISLF